MTLAQIVFFLDVDNTLLDNDQLKSDLGHRITTLLGPQGGARFWMLYEQVRRARDVVDYPRTIELMGEECGKEVAEALTALTEQIPYRSYVYPGAFEAIRCLKGLGVPVILSDGDSVFQPRKIVLSGLADAVDGRVLVYRHKENELSDWTGRYPADHYVIVDDKPRIAAALERADSVRFTTVLVCQGKYAQETGFSPEPDVVLPVIGDLCEVTRERFLGIAENKVDSGSGGPP